MNLFLAWSGVRSYRFASALLSCVRQVFSSETVSPFFSPEIEPGTPWFPALQKALHDANAILLCVTRENLRSPWMHFELGTHLAVDRPPLVLTSLLDVEPAELPDPLRGYQAVTATEEGTLRLIETLGAQTGSAPSSLSESFRRCWPELERRLKPLRSFTIEELVPGFERMFQRKTFREPMEECVDQSWLDRYYAARQTLDRLQSARSSVDARWQTFQVALLQQLISEVDGYVREMRRFLISEAAFERSRDDGRLDLARQVPHVPPTPPGDAQWAAKRTESIRQLVTQLLDPDGMPVFADSVFYLSLTTPWRRQEFVHRKEAELDAGDFQPGEHDLMLAARSPWDLDRIVCYIAHESGRGSALGPARLVKQAQRELDTLSGRGNEESSLPLLYSLRALAAVPDGVHDEIRDGIKRVASRTQAVVKELRSDSAESVRDVLRRLETADG